MSLIREREALEELLHSEGWRVFRQYIVKEWGGGLGYFTKMHTALAEGMNPLEGHVVHRCAIEINKLQGWPKRRIEELKGAVDDET